MAELRLLPLLTTHLTVPEIAAELFLSPHTIRSQMKSIYRKLEASNRHQAVTRARETGPPREVKAQPYPPDRAR
jgi:LuxR family transcriptional regulator, maltose regulon positive regulatory protein